MPLSQESVVLCGMMVFDVKQVDFKYSFRYFSLKICI